MQRSTALNPIDEVHALFDDAFRNSGAAGFNCIQLILVDAPLDYQRLHTAAAQLAEGHPLVQARLDAPWWRWHPRWRWPASANQRIPVDIRVEGPVDSPVQLAAELLNQPLNPCRDAPVQIFVRRLSNGTEVLALTWSHVLTDARGGDFLLGELARAYVGEYDGRCGPGPLRPPVVRLPGRTWMAPMLPRGGQRSFNPWPTDEGSRLRLQVLVLNDQESRRVQAAAQQLVGFGRHVMIYVLAAYLRTMAREARRCGQPTAQLDVQWSVGLRDSTAPHALVPNENGVVYASCGAAETQDLEQLIERLTRAMIEQLGQGEQYRLWYTGVWLGLVGAPLLRLVNRVTRVLFQGGPHGTALRYSRQLLGGATTWGGHAVTGGFSTTVCWPEVPVVLGISETAGKYHLDVTWLDGAMSEAKAQTLLEDFREELLGG